MTDDLHEHLLEAEELPPEWLAWLDSEGVPGEPGERGGTIVQSDAEKPETPWNISGDRTATWALRKIAEAEAELRRIKDAADQEIKRVSAWRDRAGRQPQRTADFFRDRLREYLRALIEEGKVKLTSKGGGTYKLPAGDLTRRAGSTSVEFYDEEAFIAWALDNRTELVKIEARKQATKDALLAKEDDGDLILLDPETGEVVPGVHIITGEATDDAKVAPDA